MLSTQSLAYTASLLSLVFFLGKCDSKAPSPTLYTSSNSSSLGSDSIFEPSIDAQEPPEQWFKSIENGQNLYKAWLNWNRPDVENRALYSHFAVNTFPSLSKLTHAQKAFLHRFYMADARTVDRNFKNYDFWGPEAAAALPPGANDVDSVHFNCEISPQNHVIMVTKWERDSNNNDWTNAGILWGMWRDAMRRTPRLLPSDAHLVVENLAAIFYDPVSDPTTLALIKYAIGDKNYEAWDYTAIEDVDDDNLEETAYWALLGSPAGANVQSLLIEHKSVLRGLHVGGITAVRGNERKRILTSDSEPDPSEPHGSAADDRGWMEYGLWFQLVRPADEQC